MTTLRIWFISLLACLSALPAFAEWQYLETWTDPITELELRAATTTSESGVVLHLYRYPTGRVYAQFALPEGTADLIKTGIAAEITPAGFDTREIELREEPGRFVEYGFSTGRLLRARLWHGQGDTPTIGTLFNLINAESLSGLFRLADGSTLDAIWSLEGAGLPIAQALGIKVKGIAAGPDWEQTASRALMAAMTACQFPKLDVACVQQVSTCSSRISEDRDIEGFEACISAP